MEVPSFFNFFSIGQYSGRAERRPSRVQELKQSFGDPLSACIQAIHPFIFLPVSCHAPIYTQTVPISEVLRHMPRISCPFRKSRAPKSFKDQRCVISPKILHAVTKLMLLELCYDDSVVRAPWEN